MMCLWKKVDFPAEGEWRGKKKNSFIENKQGNTGDSYTS
uniref:Uncharacterized protein n=1 Tax=Anguilla anguilla TaxID=7936 RepID=A0A0E9UL87_ANGAN